jgi:hypothetical protein
MDAYLWYTNESLRHLVRAGSPEQARERIAVTHGPEVAERAVILPVSRPSQDARSAPAA